VNWDTVGQRYFFFVLGMDRALESGARVVVTGNTPELGNWDPYQGVELRPRGGDWVANVPRSSPDIEYKFAIVREEMITWEVGYNRNFTGARDDFRYP